MKKIVIIVGPTGVGKTSLSIDLAKHFQTEIISGDSMQVYREMTIGTAKVTEEEAQGIKHHMVNTFSYRDEYHVKMFQTMAREIIEKMSVNHQLPIICGGTGLYIKSLYYDYEFSEEPVDESFAQYLKQRSDDECYALLQVVDPKACATIHHNNRKRVERALMRAHLGNVKSEAEQQQQHQPIYDAYVIGLTTDREVVYDRINKRVEIMIQEGLEEEIKGLIQNEEDWNLQSLQGIGYKEWKGYFHQEETLDQVIEKIQKNSRNYAKRQYTWFNNQMKVNWYDIAQQNWKEKCINDVEEWLKQ